MATAAVEKREELKIKSDLATQILEEVRTSEENVLDFSQTKLLKGETEAEKLDSFNELHAELNTLAEDLAKLETDERAKDIERIAKQAKEPFRAIPPPREPTAAKSLGQMFIESDAYKTAYKEDRRRGVPATFKIDLKTLFITSAGWAPESTRIDRVVDAVTRPVQLLDLIPVSPTDQASIVYMEETTRTHASVEVVEGGAYAEDTFALTERTSTVRKIASNIPVTDEQLDDENQVRSYLDARLRFGLRQRLDLQVINGDGVAPNLEGILNVTGIQTQAKGADPTFDAIHKALTLLRVTGRSSPDAVVLHPTDWEQLRLVRTTDGIYILGNPSIAGPMTVWGLPVTLQDAVTAGTGLVGDFGNFSHIYDRRGVEVQVGFVGDQFKEGEATLRADMRVAFVVFRPAAFANVTGI